MYPYLNIFGFAVTTYWVCSVVGFFAVVLFLILRNKKRKVFPLQDLFFMFLYGAIGAIIGAKLLHLITLLPMIIANFNQIQWSFETVTALLSGGGVFYGGFYGMLYGVYRYCHTYKFSLKKLFIMATPAFPLFHFFGRIGCFLSGCCYGVEVPREIGIVFNEAISAPNGVPLMPVQLIEAGCNLLLFFVLLITEHFMKHKELNLFIYMISYAVIRFTLEFFRGDLIRGLWFGLSTSQWIALITIVVSIVFVIKYLHKEKVNKVILQ